MSRQWPAAGSGAWNATVLGATACCHSPFEESHHCHYPSIVWPQAKLQGNTARPSTGNWIKDLLGTAPPIRARLSLDSPTASPSHQKASTSLLSLSIRR